MSILYFLPFLGAMLYGFNYAILGSVLKSMSISTFMFYNFFVSALFTSLIIWFDRANLNTTQITTEPKVVGMLVMGIAAAWCAWLITTMVIKHVNPTYAAIGEIAYPVFVPIFAWLLFRDKQWDMATLIGGGLVFAGLFVIIYSKLKAPAV